MTQHPEIITAPFTIWIAPVGTAFPAMSAAPGEPWRLLGTSGARNYDEGGVVLASSQQWISAPPPAGQTTSTASAMESEELRVRLDLIDLTLEQFALVMGSNAVTAVAAAPGTAGYREIGLSIGPGNATEFALLVRGPSPYNEDLPAQFQLPRACQVGNPQPVLGGGSAARLAVEFKLLPDPAATSEAHRFGRLMAEDTAALPPVFSEAPSISGSALAGQAVTLDFGTIVGGSFAAARLLAGGEPVSFTGTSYTPTAEDAGATLVLEVDATGAGGTTTAVSAAFGPVTIPATFVLGSNGLFVGDSRIDNTVSPQAGAGAERTTGVPASTSVQSIVDATLQELPNPYPVQIVGQWTRGGGKSSQFFHDHALAVQAARNPHIVYIQDPCNDVIDYRDTGGLGPIPTGDPDLDPAFLPRVGDREPVGDGLGQQGTTYGNVDKALTFWNDGVANGLGRSVPVDFIVNATGNASRKERSRLFIKWLLAQKALGRYPNATVSQSGYTCMLTDPAQFDGPIEGEVIRSDLKGDGTQGAANENEFLHQVHAEARHIGRARAADPQIIAMYAGLPSLLTLPTGSNDSSFINANPNISLGDGSGGLGYPGSASPAPTGPMAQSWSIGHNVTTGTIGVATSFDENGDLVVTITRTGGSLPDTARTVQVRGTAVNITPVAGDMYVLDAEFEAPARNPLDFFGVDCGIFVFESGMVDDRGQSIASATYGAMINRAPNPFAPDGGNYIVHGVPFHITPAMAASATGTIPLEPRLTIAFSDAMNSDANGPLVVKLKKAGIPTKRTGVPHTSPPAVPAVGAACTAAPQIIGNLFVGSTVTLSPGTFASGSVTASRLIIDGEIAATGASTFTWTEAHEGKRAYLEIENTAGSGKTTVTSDLMGPVTVPSANLLAAIAKLEGVANNRLHDFRTQTVSGNNWFSPDISGNNNPAEQTAAAIRHPGFDEELGATFDGDQDCVGAPWQGSAPSTVTVIAKLRKTVGATGKALVSDQTTTNRAGRYDASATALTGVNTLDNVSVTTRAALLAALDDGLDHIWMVTGLPVGTWPALFFGTIGGSSHDGSIVQASVIDETTPDLAAARAAVITWMGGTPPEGGGGGGGGPVTFVASSNGGANVATSATVAAPAGASTGDLLVAMTVSASGNPVLAPAGWTEGPNTGGFTIYHRIHDGSADFTFTTATAVSMGIVICAYSGAAFGAAGSWSALTTDPVAASVSATAADSVNLVFAGAFNVDTSYTTPSGFTQRAVRSTNRSLVAFQRDALVAAGATSAQTITRAAGSVGGRAVQITLSPA